MPLFNKEKKEERSGERTERKESRRVFRLDKIKEKTQLLLAKAKRWKWLAAVIGLGLVAYIVFKFV
jgi:hypothetical protein|tara:strand:- start:29 stop:226 length:198 start_codon:yes stop_codon:yes gene_type:complete